MAILKYKNENGEYVPLINIAEFPTVVTQEVGDSEIDAISQDKITKEINKKQDPLVSGVNIATINGESLLGPGNIEIKGEEPVDLREKLTVNIISNQETVDQNLIGATITVSREDNEDVIDSQTWNGSGLVFYIPALTRYIVSVSEVQGYKTPENFTRESAINGEVSHIFTYQTEIVGVTLSSDDGSSVSEQTITITNTSDSSTITTGTGSLSGVKVAYDTQYKVSVGEIEGYSKPEDQEFTANQNNRSISFTYNKIKSGSIIISKTDADPASIQVNDETGALSLLLSRFRRCLAKSTEDDKISICYLRDDNSNYYHDGTDAVLTGNEGDVMVYFPEFWYKGLDTDSDYIFDISLEYKDGYHHSPAQLVGAYKGYITSNKLYSRSGVDSTGDVSMSNFSTYARNRGNGYHLIDYQEHCIIAWMFYAKYKTRDSQSICGTGKNAYTGLNCGSTNSLGMTDTTSSNATSSSNLHVNFLGIEGCWGYKYEFIEGIHTHSGDNKVNVYDKGDFHDQPFSNIISDTKRQFNALGNEGYIKEIYAGDYMDMLPSNVSGASESTYFCDHGSSNLSSSCVFWRSFYYDDTNGGVACLLGNSSSSNSINYIGSRLAFDGTIEVIDSPTTFKAISNFR